MTAETKPQATAPEDTGLDMFNEFALDEKAMVEGKWFPYSKGVEFLIGRDGTTRHRRHLIAFYRENPPPPALAKDVVPTDEQIAEQDKSVTDASVYAGARGVLLGWKGPLKFKGKDFPYSVENAETLLRMTEFREWVYGIATNRANYAAQLEAYEEKN